MAKLVKILLDALNRFPTERQRLLDAYRYDVSRDQRCSRVYTTRELAARLNVSVRQLSRLRAADSLPRPLPFPGHPRWSIAEVERWLSEPKARSGIVNGRR